MKLPLDFISTITRAFGEDGTRFLADLPTLIKEASARWGLKHIQPVSNLSYNFVAFAESPSSREATPKGAGRGQGEGEVVLKIGVPHKELFSEMAALRLFDGEGVCQLLDADQEKGMFLLERLKPGRMLSELDDDDERTHIAVDVMERLWKSDRVIPDRRQASSRFIQLSGWFDALKEVRLQFHGGTGPFPREIFERVESELPRMLVSPEVKLLHGDFHHFNILSSDRGWLAIDPKGVIGPAGYEIGPLMINPWGGLSDWNKFRDQSLRRIGILSERLGWERETIIGWSLAHAVLSSWWDYPNLDWGYSLNCAKVFAGIK